MAFAFKSSTWEAEAGESLNLRPSLIYIESSRTSELQRVILSQKTKTTQSKPKITYEYCASLIQPNSQRKPVVEAAFLFPFHTGVNGNLGRHVNCPAFAGLQLSSRELIFNYTETLLITGWAMRLKEVQRITQHYITGPRLKQTG